VDAANSLVASLSVIAASVVVTPAMSQPAADVGTNQPAVTFTAATQPLPAAVVEPRAVQPAALPAVQQFDPLAEQVDFHVAFVSDFLTTGAVLFEREFAIPGTLAQDIGNGTPVPVALNSALQAFIQVELDAGLELVDFAGQYIDFQLRFVAKVLQNAVDAVTAIPPAVAGLVTSTTDGLAPAKHDVVTTSRLADTAKPEPSVDVSPDGLDDSDDAGSNGKDGATTSSTPKRRHLADETTVVRTQSDSEGSMDTSSVDGLKPTTADSHKVTTTSATDDAHKVTTASAAVDSHRTSPASADEAKPKPKHGDRNADATSDSKAGD
jgi:hypothetical protein